MYSNRTILHQNRCKYKKNGIVKLTSISRRSEFVTSTQTLAASPILCMIIKALGGFIFYTGGARLTPGVVFSHVTLLVGEICICEGFSTIVFNFSRTSLQLQIFTPVCVFVRACVRARVCECMFVCVRACSHVCVGVSVWMWVRARMCVCARVRACSHVCVGVSV